MKITYSENCTRIENSYQITDVRKIVLEIIRVRHKNNLPITRDYFSYRNEIRGHNRLYKLGLFRSHTRDTDMQENISKLEDFIWRIIGG